jgi:hypothetical protein
MDSETMELVRPGVDQVTQLSPPLPPLEVAPPRLVVRLLRCDRQPDEVIGKSSVDRNDYMRRWYIIPHASNRTDWRFLKRGNAFLHNFNRSDDDRSLHDHPWKWNISILIKGRYWEHLPGGKKVLRKPGRIVFRNGTAAHRVELLKDEHGREIPVWTIFLTGPKCREWGFHCKKGWVHWKDFTAPGKPGEIGPGCGDE